MPKRTYYLDEDTFGGGGGGGGRGARGAVVCMTLGTARAAYFRSCCLSGVQTLTNLEYPITLKNVIYDSTKEMYGVINDGLKGGYQF